MPHEGLLRDAVCGPGHVQQAVHALQPVGQPWASNKSAGAVEGLNLLQVEPQFHVQEARSIASRARVCVLVVANVLQLRCMHASRASALHTMMHTSGGSADGAGPSHLWASQREELGDGVNMGVQHRQSPDVSSHGLVLCCAVLCCTFTVH